MIKRKIEEGKNKENLALEPFRAIFYFYRPPLVLSYIRSRYRLSCYLYHIFHVLLFYTEAGGNNFLRNFGTILSDYTRSHRRKQ
jgi:hypothetical protein